jgi:hypothetical protein
MEEALVEKGPGRVDDSALHGCSGDFNREQGPERPAAIAAPPPEPYSSKGVYFSWSDGF